jgi:hypothetical protein
MVERAQVGGEPVAHGLLDAGEHSSHFLVHDRSDVANELPASLSEVQPDCSAVVQVPEASDVTSPFEPVEDASDGLRLLREVVGDKMGLRPIERIDREQRDRLHEGDIPSPFQALV